MALSVPAVSSAFFCNDFLKYYVDNLTLEVPTFENGD